MKDGKDNFTITLLNFKFQSKKAFYLHIKIYRLIPNKETFPKT